MGRLLAGLVPELSLLVSGRKEERTVSEWHRKEDQVACHKAAPASGDHICAGAPSPSALRRDQPDC